MSLNFSSKFFAMSKKYFVGMPFLMFQISIKEELDFVKPELSLSPMSTEHLGRRQLGVQIL